MDPDATTFEATTLLDRIVEGAHDRRDIERLRSLVSVQGDRNHVQIGRYNVDISGGHDIRIGDHIYQGANAGAIAAVIREAIGEPEPVPSRLYIAVVSIGVLVLLSAFGVFGYTMFTAELDPTSGPPEGVILAGALFFGGFVWIVVASIVRAIINPRSVMGRNRDRRNGLLD